MNDNNLLEGLPSIAFSERTNLPQCCAVYFALSEQGAVLYIGKSMHLRSRWRQKPHHHREQQLIEMGCTRLLWLVCPKDSLLDVEREMIEHFAPPLNGLRKPVTRRKYQRAEVYDLAATLEATLHRFYGEPDYNGYNLHEAKGV
jgi:excinuclease UvrABC nuclease subunit